MMGDEEDYRIRLEECLAEAEVASLPHVRGKHLRAAKTWKTLLDLVMERKANVAALQQATAGGAMAMSDISKLTEDLPPEVRDREGEIADGLLTEPEALEEAEDIEASEDAQILIDENAQPAHSEEAGMRS